MKKRGEALVGRGVAAKDLGVSGDGDWPAVVLDSRKRKKVLHLTSDSWDGMGRDWKD